jgi:hypothetical protein
VTSNRDAERAAPLLINKLIEPGNIVIDVKTGSSGAGRGGADSKFGYAESKRTWCPTVCSGTHIRVCYPILLLARPKWVLNWPRCTLLCQTSPDEFAPKYQ